MTGEDLGYKPSALEEKKCDYSPLGKTFNKGLTEEDTREGLLKSVKNIKDKNEELLKEIKDQKKSNKDSKASKTRNPLVYDQNQNHKSQIPTW